MIEQFLCHGAHAYNTLGNGLCVYIYSGTLTDLLAGAVVLEGAYIFLLTMLRRA